MTTDDLIALSPLIVTATVAVVVLLAASVRRHHGVAAWTTVLGLGLALVSISWVAPRQVTPLLIIDGYTLFYTGLVLAAAIVIALLGFRYLEQRNENREEFYVLLVVSTLGAMVMVASSHFVSLFLGLEILSVGLYVMVAYLRRNTQSIEAGIKYLILGGASSGFLVFGMALIYAQTGTMELAKIGDVLGNSSSLGLALPGLGLMVTGIGFKLAVVPFHLWTPDVYQGAPAPVTAFVATVSKGGMIALLLRYFAGFQGENLDLDAVMLVFGLLAAASMLVGNLLALLEDNVKRILAYSSIAHLGYVLVGFLATGQMAAEAVTFYLVAYFITTLAAFGVLTVLSDGEREAERIDDYRGLFWRRPWLATLLTASLLSLAGIPLTIGFIGKFFVVAAGVSAALWALVLILVVGSVIGLFYYLRIVVVMFDRVPESRLESSWPQAPKVWGGAAVALVVLAVSLLCLGVYPTPLVDLIRASVSGLY